MATHHKTQGAPLSRRKLLGGVAAGALLAVNPLGHGPAAARDEWPSNLPTQPKARVSMGPALSFPAPSDVALFLKI